MEYPAENNAPPASTGSVAQGIAMTLFFVVGLGLGFFGRPLLLENAYSQVPITAEAMITSTPNPVSATVEAPTPTLMEYLMADARHIQGDLEAPITIIEFSDFK